MRAILVVFLALVGFAVLVSRGSPDRAVALRRDESLEWGLYQILWSSDYGERLDRELSGFASTPHYVMFYRDLERPFPKFAIDRICERGATPIVSLELWRWHGPRNQSYLPALIAGEYDTFLHQWARDAADDGRRVLLRFGFEFNGDWFTWSGDPDGYVAAWRHAREIFRQRKADNVQWVWSPNVVSRPETTENDMHRYYPGDAFVDWIGVDGYNFGDDHDRWHSWQSFEQVFSARLVEFQKRYADKPVMITEFGCAVGSAQRRARWIRESYLTLERFPQVKAAVWFNFDKRSEGEPNFRIDATAGALQAFNETYAAPPAAAR